MKILCYDCFSGISGDMNLGAMLDLGVNKTYLIDHLNKLNLKGWKLVAKKDQRHGIAGTKVTVKQTRNEHEFRYLADIEKIINESGLDNKTKVLSKKIFMKIAEAEASVHGIPVEKVHFHEVGAIDSIIDIVGAAICYNALNPDAVHVSAVELGGGLVKCEHGMLPVPAPATAEILKGIPVKRGGVDFEATTPTGAAILAVLGTQFNSGLTLQIEKTGYGVGQKDHPDIPNLLRVYVGENDESQVGHDALLIECNIDDMNPEFFEYISEKLFIAGASDVFISNIIMKKGRPGNVLNVICETNLSEPVKNIIFTESTSLGIRTFTFRKDTLVRKFDTVQTIYGAVTIKRSYYKDIEVSCKPEFDECRKIAIEKGIPVKEVYNNIMASITKHKPHPKSHDKSGQALSQWMRKGN
ncbi:MAG: nickel pincer cofactor biosynthesis protein LarC [Bacteroidales bacterium]|nr:nickel pincer cofactor biosynthesis protein LarC [Bacteroidales bacterium]